MKHIFLLFSLFLFAVIAKAQNTGIGTTAPLMKLHVQDTDSALMILENTQTPITNRSNALYFKTGSYYTGAIKSIGTGTAYSRVGLFSYASGNANGLKEYLSVADNGNVGIGNTDPQLPLSFATVLGKKISFYRGNSGDVGLGVFSNEFRIHSDYSGSDITFGYDDLTNGFTERMRVKGNGDVGIGTNAPAAKLDIVTIAGSDGLSVGSTSQKVVVRPGGIFGAVAGTSTGSAFHLMANNSINLTLSTTGNVGIGTIIPQYKLDVYGRMRLAYASNATAGMWLNKQDNTEATFVGNFNDSIYGIYGASTGWQFYFNHLNGNMGIANSNPRVNLSFAATTGKKISLYPGGTGDVGMGVYGNEFRLHSDYSGSDITFGYDSYASGFTERMRVKGSGQVCIGTNTPASGYMLSVNGKIISEEVRVQLKTAWPDYVFSKNYKLLPLNDVENYISENNHLPNVPAAADVEKSGIALGEMQTRMMEKIEELTLYVIDLKKEIEQLKKK